MDIIVNFIFRNISYRGTIYIDNSKYPCLVFVLLEDKELIRLFGDEITIRTDLQKLLPDKNDYRELREIRQNIFDVVKTVPEFCALKKLARY